MGKEIFINNIGKAVLQPDYRRNHFQIGFGGFRSGYGPGYYGYHHFEHQVYIKFDSVWEIYRYYDYTNKTNPPYYNNGNITQQLIDDCVAAILADSECRERLELCSKGVTGIKQKTIAKLKQKIQEEEASLIALQNLSF